MNPRDLSQNPGCPRSFCLGSAKITSRKNPLRSKVFLGSLIWFLVAVQLAIAVIRAFLDFRNREACCMSFQGDQNGAAMGSTSATKIPRSGAIRCPWKTLAGKEYKRRGQASTTRPIDRMLEHAIPNRGRDGDWSFVPITCTLCFDRRMFSRHARGPCIDQHVSVIDQHTLLASRTIESSGTFAPSRPSGWGGLRIVPSRLKSLR